MAYIGKEPASGIRNRFSYTATAGQTTFSGSDDESRTLSYTDGHFTDVFLNGVKLDKSDYTATSGTSIVLDEGAAVDDVLEVLAFDTFSVFSGEFGSDVTVGGTLTASADAAITGDLTVDTDTLYVDSSSGNVGIGTTSPVAKLHIENGDMRIEKDTKATIGFKGHTSGSTALAFRDANAAIDRMTIDSSGNVLVGRTSVGDTGNGHSIRGGDSAIFSRNASGETMAVCRNNSTGDLIRFRRNGTVCGEIVNTGTTTVSYNTASDYRLKENSVSITDGITRVKLLQPKRFNFIAEPSKIIDGFMAHEAQSVVPEAVTGTKDQLETWAQDEIDDGKAPANTSAGDNKLDDDGNTIPKHQGIDQAKLVPLLTAALQEAITKIETLETKVAALEAV